MKVQLLGVTLDSDLSMSSHVSKTISSCFYQLRRLKSIRRPLPMEKTKTLINALVFSRCDNQNGLFDEVAQKQIDRLQQILNASDRLIYGGTKRDHITPLLRDKLHWLRFRQRITYKLPHGLQGAAREIACIHPRTNYPRFSHCSQSTSEICQNRHSHLDLPASAP